MNDRIKCFLEDITFNSDYEILEFSKHKDELLELANKKGLKVPSKDLALFKCKYAYANEENRNGCTLTRKEVKKALGTLTGKAIDKDHLRRNTIGYWLDAELDGDTMIAYGAFWKSNFEEEYEEIASRMKEGKVKVSFEAWGEREYTGEKSYIFHIDEFSGGALLFDTQPAFPNADVLEFAKKKEQVLELAKLIEEPSIKGEIVKEKNNMEEAKLDFYYDQSTIGRIMSECECPQCKVKGYHDINSIDFDNSEVMSTCYSCGGKNTSKLVPDMKIVKKGKKIEKSTEDALKQHSHTDKKSVEVTPVGGSVVDVILKKYNKASIEEFDGMVSETLASLAAKDSEIAKLQKAIEESKLVVDNAKLEIEKAKTELAVVKEDLDKRVAAEKATAVKIRKDQLGEEFSKDMSDEDILNDMKFENAKLKKEISELKKGGHESANVQGLESGTAKTVETVKFEKQKNIHKKAFGE